MDKKKKEKKKINLSNNDMVKLISYAVADIIDTSQNTTFKTQCSKILKAEKKDQLEQSINNFFKSHIGKTTNRHQNLISKRNRPQGSSITDFLTKELEGANINILEELDGFENWEEYLIAITANKPQLKL